MFVGNPSSVSFFSCPPLLGSQHLKCCYAGRISGPSGWICESIASFSPDRAGETSDAWAKGWKDGSFDRCLVRFCRVTFQNVFIFCIHESTNIPTVNAENCFV